MPAKPKGPAIHDLDGDGRRFRLFLGWYCAVRRQPSRCRERLALRTRAEDRQKQDDALKRACR